ncbi:GL11174 [Drosophila persimilis]|uniref:DNA ligase n=1 Tax=Drosophila persimilis TaxID=7234 RepID=B4GCY0_DROPE|nr:DNA ligase 1 [Drosophila persimilis]EDW31518.1 GL11174 [Drosophila persimilis]
MQQSITSYFKQKSDVPESPGKARPVSKIKSEVDLAENEPKIKREDETSEANIEANRIIDPNPSIIEAMEIKEEPTSKVERKVTTIGLNSTSKDNKEEVENYDPSNEAYHPLEHAYWKAKAVTPYLALARTFQVIEETKGRLKMIDTLSNFFSSVMLVSPNDLLPSVYLSINQLAPAYEGLELGVAETTLMKAICKATGRNLAHIKSQTHLTGDLGIVAEQSRVSQRMMFQPAPLNIRGVFNKLREIAKISGQSKMTLVYDVFVACRSSEARFFIRSLIGKLRIGIAEQSLLTALAIALVKKNHINDCKVSKIVDVYKDEITETTLLLKTAYSQCPNYDIIIPAILKYDIKELQERCPMHPGMPLRPMLAQPTKGVHEVFERFGSMHITCEWKYDGERAQIHCNERGEISIFSRNSENNTAKYPDLIARSKGFLKGAVQSYIIDSEIVAWDVERKQILPFQVLSTRKRKNVDIEEIKVQVCVYIFDLLYINGTTLVTSPLSERRKLLLEHFQEVEGEWKFATALDTNDIDEVQQFLEESVKGNCEGLMVKTLDEEATYEIAKRSRNWLKLKKDYLSNVGDSLDLVVIGGYKGKGRRTGTYGGFLLACYDTENEEYQSICKIGTGFTDEDLRIHSEFLGKHVIPSAKSYFRYDSSLEPDHWFEPAQVWEVKCADLSLSPIHRAAIGIVDTERGISLRFPRFIRIRDDKSSENATDANQVAHMYQSQDQVKNNQRTCTQMDMESEFY